MSAPHIVFSLLLCQLFSGTLGFSALPLVNCGVWKRPHVRPGSGLQRVVPVVGADSYRSLNLGPPLHGSSDLNNEKASSKPLQYKDLIVENRFDGNHPGPAWTLGAENFVRQFKSMVNQLCDGSKSNTTDPLEQLTLSIEAVEQAESERVARDGPVDAHPVSLALYQGGSWCLDKIFDQKRPIARFWVLEMVARIPYFSYVSTLHLYESLGWWRAVELRKVHAAEDWNEFHHVLIMESLGGNSLWSDRFIGYHATILYYWLVVLTFMISPSIAYQFMELVEGHAVDTYTSFLKENRELLQSIPAPPVAKAYYTSSSTNTETEATTLQVQRQTYDDWQRLDNYLMQPPETPHRPPCNTLYDVFANIALDEGEHVKTMKACQEYANGGDPVVSSDFNYSASSTRHVEDIS